MSSHHIFIKTAYFNYVDISASFKKFRQKLHLLVFVIIKSAMLLRFTNPSKRSTFNVRLVPDKNFRTIAPTVFQVGVSTNWLNFHRLSLIFSSILLQIVPNFVEIGAQEHRFYCLVRRRKSDEFQGLVCWGKFGM